MAVRPTADADSNGDRGVTPDLVASALSALPTAPLVAIVIPTYKARRTIERVVAQALANANLVIVVDDACPEHSSDLVRGIDPRVHVLVHEINRGVGGATKTGMSEAIRLGADYIVKIDADAQMDVSYIPFMIETLEELPHVDLVKGNRFADPATLRSMPLPRLIGNAITTLLVKFSSGYWTIVDPTNGFIAVRPDVLRQTDLDRLADRYFFETDLLCAFGLRRRVVAEVEMPAIYGEGSPRSWGLPMLLPFPVKLAQRFARRLLLNYFVLEINVGSLCGLMAMLVLAAAAVLAGYDGSKSLAAGTPIPATTVIILLLLFILGTQLLFQALLYDIQVSVPTLKLRRERVRTRARAR